MKIEVGDYVRLSTGEELKVASISDATVEAKHSNEVMNVIRCLSAIRNAMAERNK